MERERVIFEIPQEGINALCRGKRVQFQDMIQSEQTFVIIPPDETVTMSRSQFKELQRAAMASTGMSIMEHERLMNIFEDILKGDSAAL